MPVLDSIGISGFKSIKALGPLELRNVNVLIGANGSGKSNFLGVFDLIHNIREGKLQHYIHRHGGAESVLHFGPKATHVLGINLSFSQQLQQYSIQLSPTGDSRLFVSDERAYFWGDRDKHQRPFEETIRSNSFEAGISNPDIRKTGGYVRNCLYSFRKYHFHDTSIFSAMKQPSILADNRFLRTDGSNIAAFLYLLREKHPSNYEAIRKAVQLVAPFFSDFILSPSELDNARIPLEWRHNESDLYFSAGSLSDGTLRFIALMTLFLQPSNLQPSIILIDEPELGLHPYAITLLATTIKAVSEKRQVVVATQSPFFLNHFSPPDIIVVEQDHGVSTFNRLSSDNLQEWLQEYSLGDLWNKNKLGGRPAGA